MKGVGFSTASGLHKFTILEEILVENYRRQLPNSLVMNRIVEANA